MGMVNMWLTRRLDQGLHLYMVFQGCFTLDKGAREAWNLLHAIPCAYAIEKVKIAKNVKSRIAYKKWDKNSFSRVLWSCTKNIQFHLREDGHLNANLLNGISYGFTKNSLKYKVTKNSVCNYPFLWRYVPFLKVDINCDGYKVGW